MDNPMMDKLIKLKTRLDNDIYFKKDFFRMVKSLSKIDGDIMREYNNLHTDELKGAFVEMFLSQVLHRMEAFKKPKDDFLKSMAIIWDLEHMKENEIYNLLKGKNK